MSGLTFIQAKQTSWAKRNGIKLVGSQTETGLEIYVPKLEINLFEPLTQKTEQAFNEADGNELRKSGDRLPKMQALHSSSALGVNIFQYWENINKIPDIAFACGLCSKTNRNSIGLDFEKKLEISPDFDKKPNIDILITNQPVAPYKASGIECKFSEAYSSKKHSGLKERYLTEIAKQWSDIPNLHELAKEISPDDNKFKYLHAAQLIKHILGLKKQYGKSFRLLYLWYDVFGIDGTEHAKEIEVFKKYADKDNIKYSAITYQELIIKLTRHFCKGNETYLYYITDRYL